MGVLILMLITSAGIYGFLTSAYQKTADQLGVLDKQTEVVELKKNRFQESLESYQLEKEQLNESISELSKGLSNNVIQYKDKETGEIITTTSSSTRRALESQLNDSKEQRNLMSIKIEALTDSITKLDLQILDMESNNEVAAEIGPLRYLSKITGKSMDVIVNWFTLLIVFVFDPLAVAMVIAINKYIGGNKEDEVEPILSKKDVEVILDTNENPPQPTEKLKEASKVYKEEVKPKVESKKEFYGETKPPVTKRYNDSVKSSENLK